MFPWSLLAGIVPELTIAKPYLILLCASLYTDKLEYICYLFIHTHHYWMPSPFRHPSLLLWSLFLKCSDEGFPSMLVCGRREALISALYLEKVLMLLEWLSLCNFICDFSRYHLMALWLLTHSPLQALIRSIGQIDNLLLYLLWLLVFYPHILVVAGFLVLGRYLCCFLWHLLAFCKCNWFDLRLFISDCFIHRIVHVAEATRVNLRCW